MDKSVYSVMMSDGLVALLDREAYRQGVSRSVMLDRILANYFSVETDEMRAGSIFGIMERFIGGYDGLKFVNQASGYMAAVQSALAYKYNPTVKYSVELFPAGDLGQLKISLRSRSEALLAAMEEFYGFFMKLEKKYIGERTYGYDGIRFTRVFLRQKDATGEQLGEAIARYVSDFDRYLGKYFAGAGSKEILEYIEAEYVGNMKEKEVIL
ncbi:MAG TPA: hypothetical protein DDW54_02990 [Clostridiales bacterium]|nr:hypothetical protein [Clostridiales bacterium]